MNKSYWEIVERGAETRIREVRGEGRTYEEARDEAIAHLESVVSPHLKRLEELRTDAFRDRGRLPDLKVWDGFQMVVAAKNRKRAMELVGFNRHSFEVQFSEAEADSDWWYRLARQEGVWKKIPDEFGMGFLPAMTYPEAESILDRELESHQEMPVEDLRRLPTEEITRDGTASTGTVYTINVTVWRLRANVFVVAGCLLDDLNLVGPIWKRIEVIPTESIDSQQEGF